MNERSCFKMSEIQLAEKRYWIYSSFIIDKLIAREFKSIKHPFVSRRGFKCYIKACVWTAVSFRGGVFHTHKVKKRKSGYLAGGFGEDLSAPLGFGLISGAGGDDDAEPRSALLRTAGPHRRRKASVSPLGHSHH